jgi:sugar-specific transcriptional regulator TrmB
MIAAARVAVRESLAQDGQVDQYMPGGGFTPPPEGTMFEAVGLPEPDGSVYVNLVGHPRATVEELATTGDLSVPLTNRALARLAERGLASRLPGRPVRYLAAAPDVAVGELIATRESELRDARSAVHQLMESFRAASRHTHPEQSVEVLVGRNNIINRVAQLHRNVRSQVRGFDKPPYLDTPGDNFASESTRLRQGVRYRVVYDRQAISWPGRLATDIQASIDAGEQARVRPELPLKMLIADDRMAILPISSAEHEAGAAYVIYRSSLLDALCLLFEAEWERASPLHASKSEPVDDQPDRETRQLLDLLAAGVTDEGIARSLGCSMRTTQRRIHALLAELGATTRFQAGRSAQARGWL